MIIKNARLQKLNLLINLTLLLISLDCITSIFCKYYNIKDLIFAKNQDNVHKNH